MATSRQDQEFAEEMHEYVEVKKSTLDAAIEWIGKNLNPDDVFSEKDLDEWAESNDYVKQ